MPVLHSNELAAGQPLELFPNQPVDRAAGRYRFSGHQTFPFRYTWLPKAVQGIEVDDRVFFTDRAIVDLGVGKNMVASMRYWCEAMDLATFDGRTNRVLLTNLGRRLFSTNGWDPYLENPGTLWLLHWLLVEQPERATTWHLTFTRWYKDTFTREELVSWIGQVAAQIPGIRATESSIVRDVDTFLRTYLPPKSGGRRVAEDTFDCPLTELGLIRTIEGDLYQFSRGAKPTLPVEVFAFALNRYWERTATEQQTLQFERILYGSGSPGSAFKLSEPALVQLLEQLPAWTDLRYDETAGLRVVIRSDRVRRQDPLAILDRLYGRSLETVR